MKGYQMPTTSPIRTSVLLLLVLTARARMGEQLESEAKCTWTVQKKGSSAQPSRFFFAGGTRIAADELLDEREVEIEDKRGRERYEITVVETKEPTVETRKWCSRPAVLRSFRFHQGSTCVFLRIWPAIQHFVWKLAFIISKSLLKVTSS